MLWEYFFQFHVEVTMCWVASSTLHVIMRISKESYLPSTAIMQRVLKYYNQDPRGSFESFNLTGFFSESVISYTFIWYQYPILLQASRVFLSSFFFRWIGVNSVPVVSNLDQTVNVPETAAVGTVIFTAFVSDADGDALSYQYEYDHNVENVNWWIKLDLKKSNIENPL